LNLDPSAKNDRSEFAAEFLRIARRLMNEFTLEINGHSHRLAEIEFYLCHSKHEDVFAHQDELQKTNAQWYFHRQGGGSYKGGNYKGLDVTFGKAGDGYGGILIRAIEDIKTTEYVEGSCLVVNRILALSGVAEIEQLVSKPDFKLQADNPGILWLKRNPTLPTFDYPRKLEGWLDTQADGWGSALFHCEALSLYYSPSACAQRPSELHSSTLYGQQDCE